jgi:2-dehydropantoate 2-reductase
MKILVIGIGAIGGWLAGALAHEDVTLLARGEAYEVLNSKGLTLIEEGKSRVVRFPVVTETNQNFDCVIVATKTQDTASALANITLTPQTLVVYAQNGIPPWFMGEKTRGIPVACVVHGSTSRQSAGVIEIHKTHKIILGSLEKCDLAPLTKSFYSGGILAEVSQNIRLDIWAKLWGNMSMNPVSALTRLSSKPLLETKETRQILESMMEEHFELGKKIGILLPITVQERLAMAEKLGDFKTSSLRDVERGVPIELEGLLGCVLKLAKEKGVAMPVSNVIYTACVGLNRSLT